MDTLPASQPFSYDTVTLVIDGVRADPGALTDTYGTFDEDGRLTVTGHLGNLCVKIKEHETTITGSLSVYRNGSNAYSLPLTDVRPTLEDILDRLHVWPDELSTTRVVQLDIGANVGLSRPVAEYAPLLIEAPRLVRQVHGPASVTFGRRPCQLGFYDKGRQLGKEKSVPAEWEGRHVGRFEVRYRSKTAREFGRVVYAEDLSDAQFYRTAVEKAVARFGTIRLGRDVGTPGSYTVPAVRDWLALRGMAATGGLVGLLGLVDGWRHGGLVRGTQATRLRSQARRLSADPHLTTPSDLAAELSAAIVAAAAATL